MEATRLEAEAGHPEFWSDQERAQAAMKRLAALKEEVNLWRSLEGQAAELSELAAMTAAEGDSSLEAELGTSLERLERRLDEQEFRLTLGGEYDNRGAILAVHAGAGGTEAQDWAQMLLRMFLRWAERRQFQAEVIESSPGEEAGIKSAVASIAGPYAYGYLKSERGVHRLVRLSPYDSAHARHTSFALVEVWPEAGPEVEVVISPDDVEIETFRASGAGGQNVQKNSTAVRLRHLPSGLVVACQNERSLQQNKETALRILRARLVEQEIQRRETERLRLKGAHVGSGWGNQIRSYVLHPYRMVKDLRTGYETGDPQAVLDGDLDALMTAYLKSTVGPTG